MWVDVSGRVSERERERERETDRCVRATFDGVITLPNVKWLLFNIYTRVYCLNYKDKNDSGSSDRQYVVLKGPDSSKCH